MHFNKTNTVIDSISIRRLECLFHKKFYKLKKIPSCENASHLVYFEVTPEAH